MISTRIGLASLFASALLAAPALAEPADGSFPAAALRIVLDTQQDVLRDVDDPDRWWGDTVERTWTVQRPFEPGVLDTTHTFLVTYRIDGVTVARWQVDTRKGTADPQVPLASGEYAFTHRFAEHPSLPSIGLTVRIDGDHVVVENPQATDAFPAGVLDEGTLLWHAASRQWIVAHEETDRSRQDVGGCSGGPEVIDLAKRVYWTC